MTAPASWTVFLDRDGVLNRKAPEGDYIRTPEAFAWLPGVLAALRALGDAGARMIVVTNQRGVGRGLIQPADLEAIHTRLRAEARDAGATVEGIFVCPHAGGTCDCRKPGIGLFQQAQRSFPAIDFHRAIMVGDNLSDMQAGRAIGARTVLVGQAARGMEADATAASLADAVARLIIPWITGGR